MHRWIAGILLVLLSVARAQVAQPGLHGIITDPSGSVVPEAVVQLRGPGGEQRQSTGPDGRYSFPILSAGKYEVRFIAKGFTLGVKQDVDITVPVTLDYQLTLESTAEVVNVQDTANAVSVDPTQNANALVIGQSEIDALSDDPDVLSQQLLALAGPAAGPNGGQIFVDGFSGANLPPKASIQEIRINSNPYSPEFDYPGSSIIQIITKPGTNTFHASGLMIYNKEALNSRSPLLAQSKRPPYQQQQYNGNFSGPLKKNKASYTFNFNRNTITSDAFIYATALDSNLNPVKINQTLVTPFGNWNIQPQLDYAINSKNTLTVSFFNGHNHRSNIGVGDFGLASRGFSNHANNNQVQIMETAILSPRMVMDTRFQYYRNLNQNTDNITIPSIIVAGAFTGGGAQVGNSGAITHNLELNSSTSYAIGTHTFRWGGRLRGQYVNNTSLNNFGGTYTFQAGMGPALDANNQPVPGASIELPALEVYRRTLLFQKQGLNDAAIRALGGGAYQFSLTAGQPTIAVKQSDIGLYFADDWRARPNVTVSYGLRYETQSNISDGHDFAPRIAVAWGIGSRGGKPGKTVLRVGVGAFYNRIPLYTTLNALRFNGINQQSFVVFNPGFFPSIPSPASLQTSPLPQQIQTVDSHIQASQTWQASIGADRQINKYVRVSVNYNENRGIYLQRTRDINAPLPGTFTGPGTGVFPFSDTNIRMLTEATGFSRTHQLTITPSLNYKRLFLAGYYTLSYGKSDAEGQPADPYNLRAEWGPSSYGDTRDRVVLISNLTLPGKIVVSPQFQASSGAPYNITIGRDLNGDSIIAERPSLATGISPANCTGVNLIYEPQFGCFNLNPAPGTAISRNAARGPRQINLSNLSVSRTWILGGKDTAPAAMVTVPGPGGTSVQVPAAMAGGLAPPPTGRKYNLTLTVNSQNPLNHTIYTAPSGDLLSPFFGVFRNTANGNIYNRQVTGQLRLSF